MHTLSVSALNEQIKGLLETSFQQVLVEGELSRITFHNSGHIYFTLKDRDSVISAVMFRGNASRLKFRLEEGLKVVINAALTLYKPRGAYQLNCFSIEPSGQGALAFAYEQLKQRLMEKGYFSAEHKKPLPSFVKKIALITSATGAALQDMLHVANSRYRLVDIDVYDVLVQGEGSVEAVRNAIVVADAKGYDVLVVSRGGGSIEDLWTFNEESVAEAIFFAKTPIISAVGHEIDTLISDFVADVRAPTPSAAMEILLPDAKELIQTIDMMQGQFTQLLQQKVHTKRQELQHLLNSFEQHSFEKKLRQKQEEILQIKENFHQAIEFKFVTLQREKEMVSSRLSQTIDAKSTLAQNQLLNLKKMLESQNPKLKTKKGFAQLSQNGKVVDILSLEEETLFELQSDKVVVHAKVLKKENIV